MVVLGAIIFLSVPVLTFHSISLKGVDYKTVYGSAKSLFDGRNPYDSANLQYEYTRSGGDISAASDMTAFKPFQALYPPSSLFLLLPFTLLPYKAALALWLALSGLLFVTTTFLIAEIVEDWASPMPLVLLGLFLATSMMLLITAQPSSLAISLCVIGVWSLLRHRFAVGGAICFALSLALKPQMGGLVLVYFLVARGPNRRRAFLILLLAGLFCVPGLWLAARTPAAAHWPSAMSKNIAGSALPGNVNDPGPGSYDAIIIADLHPVVALFNNTPEVYQGVSWVIGGGLLLVWLSVALRAPSSLRRDLLGVAAIACLSLLPIYHRDYDTRLLILTFPAVAMLVAEGGTAGLTAIWMTIAMIFGTHSRLVNMYVMPHVGTPTPWKKLLFLRTTPLLVLTSGVFYLVLFATTKHRPELLVSRRRDEFDAAAA